MFTFNIILSRDNLTEAVPYFCMRCRNRLFHINRDILVVWQGESYPEKEIPRGMGKIEIKCRGSNCGIMYNFYYQ